MITELRVTRSRLCAVAIVLVVAIASLPFACNRSGNTNADAPHPRIISHTPAITQMIFSLELGDHLVGVSNWCQLPADGKYSQIPRVCDANGVRVEKALSLQPDIIFTQVDPSRGMFDKVKHHLPDVKVQQLRVESLADIFAAVKTIGDMTDRQQQAAKLAADMQQKLSVLDNHGEQVRDGKKLRVLFLSGSTTPMTTADGTFIADMIHRAGAANAGNEVPGDQLWRRVKVETVINAQPDVLIVHVDPSQVDTVNNTWANIKEIPAARNGCVYVVSDDRWVRPGPSVCDMAAELRRMIPVPAYEIFGQDNKMKK